MKPYLAGSVCFILGSLLLLLQQETWVGRLTCLFYLEGSVMFLIGTLRTLRPPEQ